MKKRRSDSPLDAQTEHLDRWLFEENLSYRECLERLSSLGVSSSAGALSNWRQRRAQERVLEKIAASARASKEVLSEFQSNGSETFAALAHMIGQTAFEMRMANENLSLENLKDLAELAALGLKAQHDTKALELRDQDLALKRDRFEFDAAKAALQHLDELMKIKRAPAMPEADKINAVRQRLFGVLPTNPPKP